MKKAHCGFDRQTSRSQRIGIDFDGIDSGAGADFRGGPDGRREDVEEIAAQSAVDEQSFGGAVAEAARPGRTACLPRRRPMRAVNVAVAVASDASSRRSYRVRPGLESPTLLTTPSALPPGRSPLLSTVNLSSPSLPLSVVAVPAAVGRQVEKSSPLLANRPSVLNDVYVTCPPEPKKLSPGSARFHGR